MATLKQHQLKKKNKSNVRTRKTIESVRSPNVEYGEAKDQKVKDKGTSGICFFFVVNLPLPRVPQWKIQGCSSLGDNELQ